MKQTYSGVATHVARPLSGQDTLSDLSRKKTGRTLSDLSRKKTGRSVTKALLALTVVGMIFDVTGAAAPADGQADRIAGQTIYAPQATLPPIAVTLSKAAAQLRAGQTLALTASVANSANVAVKWTLSAAVGSISTNATGVVYTAPRAVSTPTSVIVKATSVANSSKFATAVLSLIPTVAISLSPLSADLVQGQTQQFTPTVTGATDQSVTWSVSPAFGSVSASGLYTPPASVAADQSVVLMAQSNVDPAAAARVPIAVRRPPLQFSFDDRSLTSLQVNGQNFLAQAANFVQGGSFQSPTGAITSIPWYTTASAVRTKGVNYYQHVYNSGQAHQFTVRVTLDRPDGRTLKVTTSITNNDLNDDLIGLNLLLLPLNVPSPIVGRPLNNALIVNQFDGLPADFIGGAWGSAAVWQDFPSGATLSASYNQANQSVFNLTLTSYSQRNYQTPTSKTGVRNYASPVRPGTTQVITSYLRFGSASETVATLAPEGFNSYNAAFPATVNWPDRRPIATWYVSEGTKRSNINPRGYLWDPTLDVSSPGAFQRALMSTANGIITRMNSMSPKPQGIIVWDLEGQEFMHAFTYIGHPDLLPLISPEMDAAADQMFAAIRAAGYKVGVTIRPQEFGAGRTLPSSCTSSSTYNMADKFIKLDGPTFNRGYICSAQDTWTPSATNQPYEQTWTDEDATILASLEKKIRYAHDRWGATLFYIDSNVWVKGDPIFASMFRTLSTEFPDVLLIPESTRAYHLGSTAPYVGAAAFKYYGTPAAQKNVYPRGFSVVNIAGADWANNWNQIAQSVKSGDILMFPAFWAAPEVKVVQDLYATAQTLP